MSLLEFSPICLAATGIALRFYMTATPRPPVRSVERKRAQGTLTHRILAVGRRLCFALHSPGVAQA